MLDCLTKVVDRIDTFQEDCSKLIFGLRKMLGEDTMFEENQLFLQVDEDKRVYQGKELVLTECEEGVFIEPKFLGNRMLIKAAMKKLNEDAGVGPLGGKPAEVDGQQLGGMPKDTVGEALEYTPSEAKKEIELLKKALVMLDQKIGNKEATPEESKRLQELFDKINDLKERFAEEGGTSVADVAVNPKRLMEDKTDLKTKVVEFLQKNPNPPDKAVHTLAEKLGVEPDMIEAVFYQLATEKVKSMKEGLVAGATLPAQDIKATVTGGGKAKVNSVTPSKATGLVKTATVIDTGQ